MTDATQTEFPVPWCLVLVGVLTIRRRPEATAAARANAMATVEVVRRRSPGWCRSTSKPVCRAKVGVGGLSS
jgi:hypothetical protein